jgi:probable phosphoglycerate mutase|tara:strand:+ start:7752 stop:8390 length:639 start_codon:yes stop_codon:yes gene_type:complete
MKKKVYFVRHGESEDNAKKIFHGASSRLSKLGVEQAEFVAERFTKLPVDIVLSSNLGRAQETAEIITKRIRKELVVSDLFQELIRPSELNGRTIDDPVTVQAKKEINDHAHDPKWHYSDEENFTEFRDRLKKAFLFIEERPEENIAVVSHYNAIRMLLTVMLDPEATPELFQQVYSLFHIQNTGITVYERGFNKIDPDNWKLVTWNDHAHLG